MSSDRKTPKTSQAPPPPQTLTGGGTSRDQLTPANYQHWNRLPTVSAMEAIYLSIGLEPRKFIGSQEKINERNQLKEVVRSNLHAGTFIAIDESERVAALDWINWAKSVGIAINDQWTPASSTSFDDGLCWSDCMRAIEKMVSDPEQINPRYMPDLFWYMLSNRDQYKQACGSAGEAETVKQRVYRERTNSGMQITNPLKDPRALELLREP